MYEKQVSYLDGSIDLDSLIERIQLMNLNSDNKDTSVMKFLLEDIDDYLISKFAAFSELAEDNIPKIVKDSVKLEALYKLFSELTRLENKFPEGFKVSKKMFNFIFYYSIIQYYQKQDEVNSLIEQIFLNRKVKFNQFVEVYDLEKHRSFIDWFLDFYIINRKEKIFLNF